MVCDYILSVLNMADWQIPCNQPFPYKTLNSSVDLTHNYVTNRLNSNSLVLYQKFATLTYKKIHSSGVHNYFHISVPKYIPFSTTGHAQTFMYHILKEKPILE
jgi:hypothetical protein